MCRTQGSRGKTMGSQKVLIGSKAAEHWFSDWHRKTKDTDFVCKNAPKKMERENDQVIEYHFSDAFQWLLENDGEIASPNSLYTIKVSHSFWDVHWQKTMNDISFFQEKGCEIIPEFHELLYQDWLKIHNSKERINFEKPNSEFFTKAVDRAIHHDILHEIIVSPNEPIYKCLKYDKDMAKIEEELFNKLSFEDKCKVCLEETYVIALERFLIPSNFFSSQQSAFYKAAKKVIVDLNKGFVPYFFVTNWNKLSKINKEEYQDLIEKTKDYIKKNE